MSWLPSGNVTENAPPNSMCSAIPKLQEINSIKSTEDCIICIS